MTSCEDERDRGQWIARFQAQAESLQPDGDRTSLLALAEKLFDSLINVPPELAVKFAMTTNLRTRITRR